MSNQIPVWDGNIRALPKLGNVFLYKEKRYRLEICDCGCEKVNGIDIETEDMDLSLTVRVRGNEQGNPLTSLLVKLGKTSTELADLLDEKGPQGWIDLYHNMIADEPVAAGKISGDELILRRIDILMTMGVA